MASRALPQTPPGSLKVFIADNDANSKRMIETIKSIPVLHPITSVVDVSATPYRGIDAVPTLLVDGRRKIVGTAAFEYLRGFEQELKDPVGTCSLGYSLIDGGAGATGSDWYGAF